jgi:sulfate transport system ATP-binding protein
MAIVLERVVKAIGGHTVVNEVSLEIDDGAFFVLLGPSGSGKSTVLRIVAGLAPLDQGRVLLHGRDVTHLAPQARRVGFVFQHYALFRHMTVAENVEFALRVRRAPRAERRRRGEALLELVGLRGLGGRMPRQLSGGQQQRVALARALASDPEVLLLDEPLGALDAQIRAELRVALKAIQREVGVTTVLVTHDQEEAFELADRIGVLVGGRLMEAGTPEDLYLRPRSEQVAVFLGAGNLLAGVRDGDLVRLGPLAFPLGPLGSLNRLAAGADGPDRAGEPAASRRVEVMVRPEDVLLAPDARSLEDQALAEGEVERSAFAGSLERLRVRLPPIDGLLGLVPAPPAGSRGVVLDVARSREESRLFALRPGHPVWVGVRHVHALAEAAVRGARAHAEEAP